jgi:hypothetical protein
MPRYRVTLRRSSVEIVEASNQFQAAVVARDLFGDSVEVADVSPAVGRPTKAAKATKKVAKKRRPLSPEARAKLAQNLVKARAARAAKARANKRATKATSKSAKRVAKKR